MTATTTDQLLVAILQTVARSAFDDRKLREIVVSRGAGQSQLVAYNLCDGTRSQSEVAKAAGLDTGNFSRTVSRWIECGVMFKLGEGREAKLLHAYPVSAKNEDKSS